MKKCKVLLLSVLIFMLSISFAFAQNQSKEKNVAKYEKVTYKITAEDSIWKTYQTHNDMVEATYIPKSAYKNATTEDLFISALEHPLIGDLLAYSTIEKGLEKVREYNTALDLFLQKDDFTNVIKDFKTKKEKRALIDGTTIKDVVIENLFSTFKQSIEETRYVVYTPKGTAVSVLKRAEMPKSQIIATNNYFTSTYPAAQFVSSASTKYNCHSYAWYRSKSSNPYWMNYPGAYMQDGSYKRVSGAMQATKIYYGDEEHSANVYDADSNALGKIRVKSKWGSGPVMIHKTYYGPYSGGNMSMWVKN